MDGMDGQELGYAATEFLGIHDWQPTDYPVAADWAGDNQKIDAFAKEASERLDGMGEIEGDVADLKERVTTLEESENSAGTTVTVNETAVPTLQITLSTTDLIAGSSPLPSGALYFVYE